MSNDKGKNIAQADLRKSLQNSAYLSIHCSSFVTKSNKNTTYFHSMCNTVCVLSFENIWTVPNKIQR